MIMAIFVLLLVAAGGALILRNAATGTKSIGDNYLRAQAELLAESATEYALMQAQNVPAGGCLNHLDVTVNGAGGTQMYDVDVDLAYSFEGAVFPASCSTIASSTGKDSMVLIDVRVATEPSLTTEPVSATKRSWQKL